MTHQIDSDIMPGIATYPDDEWTAQGEPIFSQKSWIKLCMKVARHDMTNLGSIMETAAKLYAKL